MRAPVLVAAVLVALAGSVDADEADTVEQAMKDIRAAEPRTRQKAAATLVGVGRRMRMTAYIRWWLASPRGADAPEVPPGVQALQARAADLVDLALRAPDPKVRSTMQQVLPIVGPPATPLLVKALADEDSKVRVAGARLLAELPDPAAIPALIGAAKDADPTVRYAVVSALGKTLKAPDRAGALAVVLDAVGDADAEVNVAALEALEGLRYTQDKPPLELSRLPAFVRAANNPDQRVRGGAFAVLCGLWPEVFASPSEDLKRAVFDALSAPDWNTRANALEVAERLPRADAIAVLTSAAFQPSLRSHATPSLARIGAPAAPALVAALASERLEVRRGAIEGLAAIGGGRIAKEHVPAIVAVTSDVDAHVRARSWSVLMEVKDPALISLAARAFADPVPKVRVAILRALGVLISSNDVVERMPEVEGAFVRAVSDPRSSVRAQAAEMAPIHGVDVERLALLLEGLLDDPALHVRLSVRQKLRFYGGGEARVAAHDKKRAAAPTIPELVERLASPAQRDAAAAALVVAGVDAPGLIPALANELGLSRDPASCPARAVIEKLGARARVVAFLRDDLGDPITGYSAAQRLGSFGAEAIAAVDSLAELLEHDEPQYRDVAATSLAAIGSGARATLPRLLGLARSESYQTQRAAGAAFARIALASPDDVDRLVEALRDRSLPADGLTGILSGCVPLPESAAPKVLPALVVALDDSASALEAFRGLGLVARPAVAPLVERLSAVSAVTRAKAARALGEIGPISRLPVPRLAALLDDPDPPTSKSAAEALGHLTPFARPAIAALARHVKAPDGAVRTEVLVSLGAAARIFPEARSALAGLLESSDSHVAMQGAVLLADLGDRARDVLPALEKAAKEGDPIVARAASAAVKRVAVSREDTSLPPDPPGAAGRLIAAGALEAKPDRDAAVYEYWRLFCEARESAAGAKAAEKILELSND